MSVCLSTFSDGTEPLATRKKKRKEGKKRKMLLKLPWMMS